MYRLIDILSFINEHPLLSKSLVLKGGTGDFCEKIKTDSINDMTFTKIRHALLPVLRKRKIVDLESMKNSVLIFLNELLILGDKVYYLPNLFLLFKKFIRNIFIIPIRMIVDKINYFTISSYIRIRQINQFLIFQLSLL